jgi:hypothetical protein
MAGLDPAISHRATWVPREITGSGPVMTWRGKHDIFNGKRFFSLS